MPTSADRLQFPASREPLSLLAVDRAVSDMRRGRPVTVQAADGRSALALAAEAATPAVLKDLAAWSRSRPVVAITARRARVLGLRAGLARTVRVTSPAELTPALIRELADPLSVPSDAPRSLGTEDAEPFDCDSAAVGLAKIARLLPAAVTASILDPDAQDIAGWSARHDLLLVDAGDVFQYESVAARTLKRVSEARVPLPQAPDTRIIAFRPLDGGLEHIAIVIGEPAPEDAVLTRLHSECFTGDLLGSLRCDCGDQLQGAIREIAAAGKGVLLYLAQEGRGIGLVNKLRAYALQDRGFDTVDANEQLGFDADERVYLPAAKMLADLGFTRVRLMTNNPAKVAALARHGVKVADRVPHAFPANRHNEAYLRTKAAKGGHLF
ncbi:MAG: GTP cyclohydrolase II [Rhodospirillales bacterium]|nr:GTP cyclohydrolase II [Rhodospirillales bacterium]